VAARPRHVRLREQPRGVKGGLVAGAALEGALEYRGGDGEAEGVGLLEQLDVEPGGRLQALGGLLVLVVVVVVGVQRREGSSARIVGWLRATRL